MKNNLNELTDKLSSLINKMKLERSGFNSEFSNLQKRMVFYKNYVIKLKKLVESDQALIDAAMLGEETPSRQGLRRAAELHAVP